MPSEVANRKLSALAEIPTWFVASKINTEIERPNNWNKESKCIGIHSSKGRVYQQQITDSPPPWVWVAVRKMNKGSFYQFFHNMPSLCDASATREDHITYNYVSHSIANKLLTQWKGIKSSADPKHRSKLYSAAGKHINMRLQAPVREIRKGNQEDKRTLFITKAL